MIILENASYFNWWLKVAYDANRSPENAKFRKLNSHHYHRQYSEQKP